MKSKPLLSAWPLVFLVFLLCGCFKDKMTRTYTMMTPVYKSKSAVLADVKSGAPSALGSPGKIFIHGRYVFINEVNKGVHILDNTDPSAPKMVSFIAIPGNLDIAVDGDVLYADLYKDLLAIDISDPQHSRLVNLVPNVFPERNYSSFIPGGSDSVIVDWTYRDTTVTTSEIIYYDMSSVEFMANDAASSIVPGAKAGSFVPGIAGSMSRFAVTPPYLYAVNTSSLKVFDINNPQSPSPVGESPIGFGIETIYPFHGKLFIGSSNGMFMYGIDDPKNPEKLGSVEHMRSCDPVVADGDYAFVTLRSGTVCAGDANQLEVMDVSDALYISRVAQYPMTNPHGLAKDGNLLFICDGKAGLKVFDATVAYNLKLIGSVGDIEAYDAIAWNHNLLVTASGGLYQFDYSQPASIRLLSKVSASNR